MEVELVHTPLSLDLRMAEAGEIRWPNTNAIWYISICHGHGPSSPARTFCCVSSFLLLSNS